MLASINKSESGHMKIRQTPIVRFKQRVKLSNAITHPYLKNFIWFMILHPHMIGRTARTQLQSNRLLFDPPI